MGNTQEILGTQRSTKGCPNAVVHLKQAQRMTSYYHAGMEHIRAQSARYGSAPTRERDSDQLSPIARAAWYVEDAFSGNFEEDMDSRTNAQRDAYVRYESLVHPERLVCVVALALVSFIEVPLWCLQGRNKVFWVGGSEVCRKPTYAVGMDIPYIATLLVEACALGYLATLCGLEVGFEDLETLNCRHGC